MPEIIGATLFFIKVILNRNFKIIISFYYHALIACENGHENVVQILINNKADPNIKNHNGFTPFYKGKFLKKGII